MEYVAAHGQTTEAEYPYTSGAGQSGTCQQRGSPKVHVSNVNTVQSYSAAQLLAAISQGPVSVTVEADKMAFQGYTGGVITGSACGTQLDHGVLAVGYGTESGEDYFLVKNSWGASWGDAGYIKLGADNICGMLNQPSQPTTD